MFQIGEDKTEYRLISKEGVSTAEFEGKTILKVSKEALTLLAQQGFHDVEFKLRREHNLQVAKILSDPEASENDKMMDCIRVFDEITNNLPQNEASFNLAKQSLLKSIQSRRITKAGVINAYFNAKLRGIDYDVTKLYYEQIPSLTLQDITNFEKQNIVGKPYRMVILGDEKNLDMKSLEKIAPIKRLSQEEIFGY